MKTEIELPDHSWVMLKEICEEEKISCSEAISRALKNYPRKQRLKEQAKRAFGLWKTRKIDALEYEDKVRKEWDH